MINWEVLSISYDDMTVFLPFCLNFSS